ncbi:unnamed protein product, partial [Menidia menidia]
CCYSDLKPNAQEDRDMESVSDSPGHAQEPLKSCTFSPKNNAVGLSSDEHENPLNGTQPNPFVYSSVPAVPRAGNSLPSGALVNGPVSWMPRGKQEKDMSPEVLPPPSELQSDARKKTAGPVMKTLATQPGVNMPLSQSETNESKLAYSTLSGDSVKQMHIRQPLTKQTIKTSTPQEMGFFKRGFSQNNIRLETKVMHQGDMKHNMYKTSISGCQDKVNSSYRHFFSGNGVENVYKSNSN